jgi:aldehyde:ferredoxin oxidoreductase
VKLLLDEGSANLDALAPESPLLFTFSPLVGSPLTTSAKFAVVSKSPLTDRINDSLASSGFAIAGKGCGCDAIMIVGRAANLSVIIIDEGKVRFETAAEYRGATCKDTEDGLRARLGAQFRVASIDLAGENGVRYATISHDGRHAGRGGSGAVLGAKNIKAIAIHGTKRAEWSNLGQLTALCKALSLKSFGPATAKYRELGTATNLLTFNRLSALPTRNFQTGTFEEAVNISAEQLSAVRPKTRKSCMACTIGCEHIYSNGTTGVRIEYESLFALGCSVASAMRTPCYVVSQRCDELGIDTISTGGPSLSRWSAFRGWLTSLRFRKQ